MADKRDFKERYWARLKQLQDEHLQARKAGDFVLAKKRKEDIRRIASVPFDSYINKLNNNGEASNTPDQEEQGSESQFGQSVDVPVSEEPETAGHLRANELQEQALGEEKQEYKDEGGPAINAAKSFEPGKTDSLPESTEVSSGTTDSLVSRGMQAGKQALNRAINAAKKFGAQIAKKAVVTFFSSPWGWAITAAVLGFLLLIIIIAVAYGAIVSSHSKVSETGMTISQPADPLADKEWIRKLLVYSGNESVKKTLTEETLQQIENDLKSLSEIPYYQDKVDSINLVIASVNAYQASPSDESGRNLIGLVQDLLKSLWNVSPISEGTATKSPLSNISGYNHSLHFGTPANPCTSATKDGKNCPRPSSGPARTYLQFVQNTCDAVDLSSPNDTPVYAVFGGEVIADSAKTALQIKTTDSNSNTLVAVYAHMRQKVKKGDSVTAGQEIGTVNLGHLHFELAKDNQCVVGLKSEYDLAKNNGQTAGQYLWNKMAGVLRLK